MYSRLNWVRTLLRQSNCWTTEVAAEASAGTGFQTRTPETTPISLAGWQRANGWNELVGLVRVGQPGKCRVVERWAWSGSVYSGTVEAAAEVRPIGSDVGG